ncbi:MAG: flagellar basal body-associated FliL family protein, partial [Pseudomonadota bacterium]
LLVGLVLALALAGGGFFAVYSGLILAPDPAQDMAMEKDSKEEREPLPDVAFVPIPPLVINLGQASSNRHLKFQAQLEVVPDAETEITRLLPRITDVLNGYLRAVSVQELEEPSALFRFRSQMLRRVQIVTGEGRVRDLLIMEFVLN